MLKRVSSNQQSNQIQFNPKSQIQSKRLQQYIATHTHTSQIHKSRKGYPPIDISTNPIQPNTRISISANLAPPQEKTKKIQKSNANHPANHSNKERESTRGSGESKRSIGVEANGGSHGRGSVHHSMFSSEDDFPWSSSFHFHCFSFKFQFFFVLAKLRCSLFLGSWYSLSLCSRIL